MEELAIIDGIASLFGNPHAENYENGCKYLKRALAVENEDDINSAIYEFLEVDNDDKLYLQVAAKFNLAICYCLKCSFDRSRACIKEVENTEYDFFTLQKDTIDQLKGDCYDLRKLVNETEQEYLAELARAKEEERIRREEEEKAQAVLPSTTETNIWKVVSIVLMAVLVLGGTVALLNFFNIF